MKVKISLLVLLFASALVVTMVPMQSARSTEPEALEIAGTWDVKSVPWYGVSPVQCILYEDAGPPEIVGDIAYNLDMIDVENVGETGEDIYVAVLDTGLMYNWMNYLPVERIRTDLGKGFSYNTIYWDEEYQDFFLDDFYDTRGFITELGQPWNDYGAPYGDGHGTHVTSIITGYNYVSTYWGQEFWVGGVAPNVYIIPVLVLDTWIGYVPPGQTVDPGYYLVGGGSYEMVAAGIRYCADLAKQLDIKIVISMSLGGRSLGKVEKRAIDYAIRNGCIVVAAAGNEGQEQITYPGAYSPVICVASGGWTLENIGTGSSPHSPPYRWWLSDVPENFYTLDENGNEFQLFVNDFSGRPNPELGQSWCDLDVCGPGSWIVGPYSPYGSLIGGGAYFGYYYVGGTSQATPHVSGIASLVLQKYPDLVQWQMQMILKIAGIANKMTKGYKDGSAIVYAWQDGFYDYEEFTWTAWDYGTGFLQADAALCTAFLFKLTMNRCSFYSLYMH
ncbi:MAG: S8 family serine peptidase [Candidatus Bathyarchaeota archaeon]|nr:S8 family serine peptidase [Candidatus Bathyarchaeota archaeon]MDH5788373.1 S8 family serine peptidase [Candidatus Bathyarchaeota archaeon]